MLGFRLGWDGEHPRDVDGLEDEMESAHKKAKEEEEADVLLGLCSARESGKLESDSSGGAG